MSPTCAASLLHIAISATCLPYMVWAIDLPGAMIYRIETRLALIVSVLAIGAVLATAWAIREGARRELWKASVPEQPSAPIQSAVRTDAVAKSLAGWCCVSSASIPPGLLL